ncbi:MAG: deoxyguanosinetriphosphate triphosphohydrolase [Desulfuromonadales bacterium]|jgi:dGTPase|nr:deoxyguanosinetriphosphate triphosphohydrolase [Desulfuromonadales bacterium]MDH3961099.1 deoxyguanosinetriphosphate triphosphohydrolase [Desulfuromonadales bacterium]MDH4025322.1 deoxyguanosinetriphosphate triphosphohydrolase [Desulfuromonadales bacterium]HKJ28614.1 deoxyguanosinetriphosphate triphosphohydrolase [Desulfuromonadales bacterium]
MERPDLAGYAAQSETSLGRRYPEVYKDDRPAYERDRDRIIHCAAFRRLEYKTQVFVNHEGDYYRTRLTHSLEVAQIGRGIARRLKLNEDLVETLALAHDLGHTPFGHTGEDVLNRLMSPYGGFEHNRQSLRVVENLEERYPDFNGLNLSWEAREGIIKHSSDYDLPDGSGYEEYRPDLRPTLEAQIIDLADEIAYNNHDIDDGLKARYLKPEALMKVDLWADIYARVKEKYPSLPEDRQILQTISHLIGHLIMDLVDQTRKNISEAGITTQEAVRAHSGNLVMFSSEAAARNRELKRFLYKNLYRHYKVERMRIKAERFLTMLFENYLQNPTLLPSSYQEKYERYGRERVVCDYIAGMTDRYALDEYKRLFDPYERV